MLLDRHSDVNAKDSEGRTPLHLAIDKAYTDIVLALLEKKPNLELKNRDGDTALLRAVKNRDVQIAQLLVSMGAKLSATDNAGDNSLHLAIRARSRRLTQILLVNPSDSKLLYRPNKLGETPYSIDQESPQPILPTIFGPIGTDVDLKNLLGFDSYSDVLADVVCEPNLSLPLTIGLYAKWGSGKSLLLPRIRDSMAAFSRTWLDGIELYWSWSLVLIMLLISTLITLLSAATFSFMEFQESSQLSVSIGLGVSIFSIFMATYSIVYYGSEVLLWNGSITTARLLARTIARLKLMLSVLTLNAPIRTEKEMHEKKMISPVSFLFADDHRLSFIGGEQALANIVQSLFSAAEEHYGTLAVRLFTALKSPDHNSKLQTICGVPVLLLIITSPISMAISSLFLIQQQKWAASVFLALALVSGTAILYLLSIRLLINLPKRRIARVVSKLHLIPFERMLQKLQKEVDLLVSLVFTLDAFTNSQTRLVVMIDGLDNCEQNKMVQLLDAVSLFFSSRQNVPFVVLLAIDPNIVIATIHQNLRAFGPEDEITGRDYLKNIVTMPFYLDHIVSLRKIHSHQNSKKLTANNLTTVIPPKERIRSETFRGSRLSLRGDSGGGGGGIGAGINSTNEIGQLFPSYDLFTNTNPRTLRRIVNSIALTGRLLRAFEVEFNWWSVYSWVSLIEQWPWRMCWIIDVACSLQDDALLLHELYGQLKGRITLKEGMEDLDRNSAEFETAFRKLSASRQDQLTVGHAKTFAPYTSNLDPYLRRLIREQRGGEPLSDLTEEPEDREEITAHDPFAPLKELLGPEAEFLFDNPMVWASVTKPLAKMSIEDVVRLIKCLPISKDQMEPISRAFYMHNLNGLALHSCDFLELRNVLNVPLGDWTLIQLFIAYMRKLKPFVTQSLNIIPAIANTLGPDNNNATTPVNAPQNLLESRANPQNEQRPTPLRSIKEEDSSSSPAPITLESNDEEAREARDDDEDTNSLASVAGSDRCLLKSSASPPAV